MTDLLSRPLLRREDPDTRAPWVAAVLAGSWSLVAGMALVELPVLLGWLAGGAEQLLDDPLRLGGHVWLLAHRVGLDLDPGHLGIAPWGLTIPVLLLLYRGGRWAAHASGVPTLTAAVRLVVVTMTVYATGGTLIALLCRTSGAHTRPVEAAVNSALIAAVGVGAGVLCESELGPALLDRLPPRLCAALRAGLLGAAAAYAGGTVLVSVTVLAHFGAARELTASLEAGLVGGALLAVISAALLPNAAMWATAYAIGPGFAVGSGTEVTPGHIDLGPVPALPVLAGLPADTHGVLSWAVLLVPVVAGVLVALRLRRVALDGSRLQRPLDALGAAAVAAGVLGLLAALSGGAGGPGRLVDVGPPGSWVALWSFLEIGAVVVAATTLGMLRERRAGPVPVDDEAYDPAGASAEPPG